MPSEQIRAIAQDPQYRQNHDLLNPMLDDANMLKPNYGELIELGIQRQQAKLAAEKTVKSAQG